MNFGKLNNYFPVLSYTFEYFRLLSKAEVNFSSLTICSNYSELRGGLSRKARRLIKIMLKTDLPKIEAIIIDKFLIRKVARKLQVQCQKKTRQITCAT